MKRIAILLTVLLFPGILLYGQAEQWLEVPDVATGVSVEMPGLPDFVQKTVYHSEVYVVKDIFSLTDERFKLVFESYPLQDDDKKSVAKAINKSIDFLALYEQGKPSKQTNLSREGINYNYVELDLASGHIVRAVVFVTKGKLFQLYVKANRSQAYGIDANFFLGSWKPGEKQLQPEPTVVEKGNNKKKDTAESTEAYQDDWKKTEINDAIEISFPATPFKKSTLVEFGTRKVLVEAYSRNSKEHRMNYVLTSKTFGPDEGQNENVALHNYIVDQLIELKKVKLSEQSEVKRSGFTASEYTLSKGIRFYKLHLFRVDDTIYHCLVKGKRKSIDRPEAMRFFNSIKTLDHHGH